MKTDVKRLLACRNRSLRRYPGKLLLGPCGDRLWADYLDSTPGFMGRLDFIHKLNLPVLFTVRVNGRGAELLPAEAVWYPDELRLGYSCGAFAFSERKLISRRDEAISLQIWENLGAEDITLECVLPDGAAENEIYAFPVHLHGFTVKMLFRADAAFEGGCLTLKPGEKRTLLFAATLGLEGEEAKLAYNIGSIFARASDAEAYFDELCGEALDWFASAPEFECSDPYISKCWWYRVYILRSCLSKPAFGLLRHETFYEGRSHSMKKTPFAPSGWEFSRLIPLSTPHTMADMRWIKRPETAKDSFRALCDTFNGDGAFSVCSVDSCGKEYCHYAAHALYGFYLLWKDKAFLREVITDFKRDCLSVFERHKGESDSLQICYTHALTGKEYQPGYWFFAKDAYPDKVRGTKEGYTPLKRVDSSVYMYLNCAALAFLCREAGDADADIFAARAEALRREINEKMWDASTGCFYDLHYKTDEKALVKHIVSVYPLWAEITGENRLKQLDILLDPAYFARGSGFASTAADCPVYSPSGGWKGDYFKGRDGCMWNGPAWPYTTCIALDAIAKQSKLNSHRYDSAFFKHFMEYTLQHFRFGDIAQPYLVELYDAETGEALSDEADYNHSFYLDLVVRHVCGLEPKADLLVFEPLDLGLDYFALEGINVRGHTVDVYFQKQKAARYPALNAGYTLLIDKIPRLSGTAPSFTRAEIGL